MKVTPVGNRVLVKPELNEKKTSSGIVLTALTAEDAPDKGTIVAVGDGDKVKEFKIGQRVFFTKYAGTDLKVGEDILKMLDNSFLIAILED